MGVSARRDAPDLLLRPLRLRFDHGAYNFHVPPVSGAPAAAGGSGGTRRLRLCLPGQPFRRPHALRHYAEPDVFRPRLRQLPRLVAGRVSGVFGEHRCLVLGRFFVVEDFGYLVSRPDARLSTTSSTARHIPATVLLPAQPGIGCSPSAPRRSPPAPPHSLAFPFFLPSACNHLRSAAASGHPTRPYPVADRERGPTRSVVWCFAPLAAVRPETGGSLERKSPKTRAPAQMLAALRTPGLPGWQERGGTGSPSMDQAGSARQPSR